MNFIVLLGFFFLCFCFNRQHDVHEQCAGCQVYHKFVDNLGLVVEYDLREETDADSDVTQAEMA